MEIKEKSRKTIFNIFFYLGLTLMVTGYVFNKQLASLDEVWIYNFARCIVDGLIPYKDISMVITPLFPYICAGVLKIFGNEMIVLRIFECFEISAILFIIYKILLRLKINKGISLIFTLRDILSMFTSKYINI